MPFYSMFTIPKSLNLSILLKVQEYWKLRIQIYSENIIVSLIWKINHLKSGIQNLSRTVML